MKRLEGKVAIVTGGSRGMGEQTVRLFAREGAKVVIADRLQEEGEILAEALGEVVIFQQTDISKESDWLTLLETTQKSFGPPDILVNNAAIQRFFSILDCGVDDFRKVLDVNLVGTFLGLKIVGGAMVRAKKGSIINVSSIDGMRGANGYASYSSSKWGVRGLSKVAAMEFGPNGVRVNSIHPGGVLTVMGNPVGAEVEDIDKGFAAVPLQRSGRPEEIANVSLFLASDEASYICGAEIAIDGGWTAGIYNPGLSGGPDDTEYGDRTEPHAVNAHLNKALAGRARDTE